MPSPSRSRPPSSSIYGPYDCEFKQTVNIAQSPKYSAYVDVKHGKGTG